MNFNDLYDKINSYELNLISYDDLHRWFKDNLTVKKYIPMIRKYSVIGNISNNLKSVLDDELKENQEDYNIEYVYMQYDIFVLFGILFSYLDIIVPNDKRNVKTYDTIMNSGLYDFVIEISGNDYLDFKNKCDTVTGINNINIVNEFVNQIANKISPETIKEVRGEINKIDLRKMKLLESVVRLNDPAIAQIVEEIKKDKEQG